MKTAVVFYSMGGNTAAVAGKLAKALSADLIELRPVRAYPDRGVRKFLYGGKSAVTEETPELKPYAFNVENYDRIIIGFPVWAANIAPPVRTFVRDHLAALKDIKIAAYACQGGSGGEKALMKLANCLGCSSLSATMILIEPKDRPGPENDRKLSAFLDRLKD